MFKKAAGTMLATMATADINQNFHGLLHGDDELKENQMEPMWEQFKFEFATLSPVDLNDDSAMLAFYANIDSVIEHNSRSDKTFTRGINQFTAMTFEEFADHYHFAENQENTP